MIHSKNQGDHPIQLENGSGGFGFGAYAVTCLIAIWVLKQVGTINNFKVTIDNPQPAQKQDVKISDNMFMLLY